jgi:hypothetical protein
MAIEAGNLIVARVHAVAEFDGLNPLLGTGRQQDTPAGESSSGQEQKHKIRFPCQRHPIEVPTSFPLRRSMLVIAHSVPAARLL